MKTIKMQLAVIAMMCVIFFAAGCKKHGNNETELPPITQTGANTFGCLINGKVWLPKGWDGRFANSRINIDPGYNDGDLTIRVYKIYENYFEEMTLTSDSIKNVGTYFFKTKSRAKFAMSKYKKDLSFLYCDVDNGNSGGNPNNIDGYIRVTRYDLQNGIFSGEFEITFNNTDCGFGDPVKITQGRFDYKL